MSNAPAKRHRFILEITDMGNGYSARRLSNVMREIILSGLRSEIGQIHPEDAESLERLVRPTVKSFSRVMAGVASRK